VRMDVGAVGPGQSLGAFDGPYPNHAAVSAPGVVPLARVALGVLLREHAALSFHDGRAGVVFRGDQLDMFFLTLSFLLHGGIKVGVETGDSQITAEHGGPLEISWRRKVSRAFYPILGFTAYAGTFICSANALHVDACYQGLFPFRREPRNPKGRASFCAIQRFSSLIWNDQTSRLVPCLAQKLAPSRHV